MRAVFLVLLLQAEIIKVWVMNIFMMGGKETEEAFCILETLCENADFLLPVARYHGDVFLDFYYSKINFKQNKFSVLGKWSA